jgi:hypothetical protein
MYRVPPARAWWPAVGAQLERGVRQRRAMFAVLVVDLPKLCSSFLPAEGVPRSALETRGGPRFQAAAAPERALWCLCWPRRPH